MNDQHFPVIAYDPAASPREWGRLHGESYREGIHELFAIRLDLMRARNRTLAADDISRLAAEQWKCTAAVDAELTLELEGICEGANLSAEQIVVLNNYTDFRDIRLADEGCSTVFVNRGRGPIAGQTWDMHGSAKHYVCVLTVPGAESDEPTILFSLVGCIGMMGYTPRGTMVGVNNINTSGAVAGVMWPAIVRKLLKLPTHQEMTSYLTRADVTSGHNYLLASRDRAEMWEVMPGLSERVDAVDVNQDGFLFHTNHCLGEQAAYREEAQAVNSTTHVRYDLLRQKIEAVHTLKDVTALLNDHENYPQSICSNYQSGAQDPAVTCGGAVGNLATGYVSMWRGDELYDANYRRHEFSLSSF